jgi:hypothetical protein
MLTGIFIIIIIIITAIELSLGGRTDKTSKKTNINETIQKYSTNNTKLSNHKYTYYQN